MGMKKIFFAREAVEVTENKSLLRGPKGVALARSCGKARSPGCPAFYFPVLADWMVGKMRHQNRLVNLIIQHLFIQSESREIPDRSPGDR